MCITLASYISDTCRAIASTAGAAGLDPHFFARLLWQESRFNPGAVSPAGAQGIAQFMPATAARRGLADAFNPAEALGASAYFLAELRDMFGNLGLAAAAYNAGEARVSDFLERDRRLPPETRGYVRIITGLAGTTWRDDPPEALDLRLDGNKAFQPACEAMAQGRGPSAFRHPEQRAVQPWAVILASHRSRGIAEFRVSRLPKRALKGETVVYHRRALPGQPGRQITAQIGRSDRAGADKLCRALRRSGVLCVVLKN